MDINNEDIDSVLALCHSLQLGTICLSLDMYITRVNSLMARILSHSEQQLINKHFHSVCRDLGLNAPIFSETTPETLTQFSTSTTHYLSNKTLIDVQWTISRIMNENIYQGYVLIGKKFYLL